ncbi:MAG: hypothetical protein AAGC72_17730 [Planctomycetota bacterium]
MRLIPQDKLALEELYLYYAITTDQLKCKPGILGRICAVFRRVTGRDESNEEILRYMSTAARTRTGRAWVTGRGDSPPHSRNYSMARSAFSARSTRQ